MTRLLSIGLLAMTGCFVSGAQAQSAPGFLDSLLRAHASPLLLRVLDSPQVYHYQVRYTRIDRDRRNRPSFQSSDLHVDPAQYFNPASTVKLPLALLALEKLNDMHVAGVNKYTPIEFDSSYGGQSALRTDTSSEDGKASIAHYIRKVFLISDNDAYNRLYEFVGQERINRRLHEMGYTDARIVRQFIPMTEDQNRHTNQVRFVRDGETVYTQAPAYDTMKFDFSKQVFVGKGHLDSRDSLINTPMDFTRHNNLPLADLDMLLRSVIFPASVAPEKRFRLTQDDYRFLYRYMSQYPSETTHPHYDTTEYFDSYVKFFLFKSGKKKIPPSIRIFNKPGWSYGYLTDASYIVDFEKNIEFLVSANIYVNSDGILNDDRYDYDSIGYPFFAEVGRILYDYESGRKRTHRPDLREFMINRAQEDSDVRGGSSTRSK